MAVCTQYKAELVCQNHSKCCRQANDLPILVSSFSRNPMTAFLTLVGEVLTSDTALRARVLIAKAASLLNVPVSAELLIAVDTQLLAHGLDFGVGKLGKLLSSSDVADLLLVSLGKDQVNFFQGTTGGLRVAVKTVSDLSVRSMECVRDLQEVDDWNEAGVANSKEEVSTPLDA